MNGTTHSVFNWQQNGATFFAQYWAPLRPKAIICVVHGYGGHGGRYAHVAQRLCNMGFGVVAMDSFGHGKTTGPRGFAPSYEASLDSIQIFLDETEKLFPSSKKFIWGHSMGAGIVANYVLRRQPQIAGAVFGSPLFKMTFHPSLIKMFLARLMNKINPAYTQNANLEAMAISRDREVVKSFIEDPLVHGRISARTYIDARRAGIWALHNADKLNIPCLLIHGTADRLTSFEASKEFASKASGEFLTFKLWNGFFHELHNEPEPDRTEVLNYITNWLEKQL
jgi:acylglycerol lipase